MKTIIIIVFTALLTSCVVATPPTFDSNEYWLYAQLETHSRFLQEECVDAEKVKQRLPKMLFIAQQLSAYTFYLPNNHEVYWATKTITEDITQLAQKYQGDNTPTATYCKLKSSIITTNTRDVLRSIGALK